MKKEYCSNQQIIFASAEDLWNKISDFYDWSWFSCINKMSTDEKNTGNIPGAFRIVNDKFFERLISVDKSNYHLQYIIEKGPDAHQEKFSSDYTGNVKLKPISNNVTLVLWKTSWINKSENNLYKYSDITCKAILSDLFKYYDNKIHQ